MDKVAITDNQLIATCNNVRQFQMSIIDCNTYPTCIFHYNSPKLPASVVTPITSYSTTLPWLPASVVWSLRVTLPHFLCIPHYTSSLYGRYNLSIQLDSDWRLSIVPNKRQHRHLRGSERLPWLWCGLWLWQIMRLLASLGIMQKRYICHDEICGYGNGQDFYGVLFMMDIGAIKCLWEYMFSENKDKLNSSDLKM